MDSLESKINHLFTELLATHDSIQVTHAVINDLAHRRGIGLDAFVRAFHYMCIEDEVVECGWTSADNNSHMAVIVVPNEGNIEHCLGKWLEKRQGVIVIEPERDNEDGIEKAKNYLASEGIQVLSQESNEVSSNEVSSKKVSAYLGFQVDTNLQSHDGWGYVLSKIVEFSDEFTKQTSKWEWSNLDITLSDTLDQLAKTYFTVEHISNYTLSNVHDKVKILLANNHPSMFELKKYHYNIPTGNNLYGGYDDGIVEAIDINHAYELARKEITEGFDNINRILNENNLPCFGYDLNELNVTLEVLT